MPDDMFERPSGEYTYTETQYGKTAEGVLTIEKGTRNAYDQRTVGSIHRGRNDDGAHLIATRYKGSGRKENLSPVHKDINRGSYKKMENALAKLLSNTNNKVHMKASTHRRTGINRPDAIMVTNTLKRSNGSTDREHLSFQNLSNQEMDAIQEKLNVLDVLIDPRQHENLTPEQIALTSKYAEKTSAEIPLGTADRFTEGGINMNDKRADFQARMREGAPTMSEQASFAKTYAAQKSQAGKRGSDAGGFERGEYGRKEGGRETGGKSSTDTVKQAQLQSSTAVKESAVKGADQVASIFSSRQQAKAASDQHAAKSSQNSISSTLIGRSSNGAKSASVSSGRGFGGGKGFGAGKGFSGGTSGGKGTSIGGKSGSAGGKGAGFGGGASAGKGGGIGR